MRFSGSWGRGGLGSVGLTAGLKDFKGVVHPKLFYDSISYNFLNEDF